LKTVVSEQEIGRFWRISAGIVAHSIAAKTLDMFAFCAIDLKKNDKNAESGAVNADIGY
jgi:hypothetical protein